VWPHEPAQNNGDTTLGPHHEKKKIPTPHLRLQKDSNAQLAVKTILYFYQGVSSHNPANTIQVSRPQTGSATGLCWWGVT
jgi:hypothetical protein